MAINVWPILNIIALAAIEHRKRAENFPPTTIHDYRMASCDPGFGCVTGPSVDAMVRIHIIERVAQVTIADGHDYVSVLCGVVDEGGHPTSDYHRRIINAMGAPISEDA